MKTENGYRVVLEFPWKSALGMFRKKSLQIGLSIFLEINIKPFKEPTVWFIISLAKIEWVIVRSQGRYRLVFEHFGYYKMAGPNHAILGKI